MADIDEIIDNFSLLDDWDDRYRYLIELGRELPPLPRAAHNDANKVQGCASQVWLDTTVRPNGAGGPVLIFAGDSDAHIVRGLIAILFAIYSGKSARRHPRARRRKLRDAGPARASDAAALERLSLHGRAHPRRCPRGAAALPTEPIRAIPCPDSNRTMPIGFGHLASRNIVSLDAGESGRPFERVRNSAQD